MVGWRAASPTLTTKRCQRWRPGPAGRRRGAGMYFIFHFKFSHVTNFLHFISHCRPYYKLHSKLFFSLYVLISAIQCSKIWKFVVINFTHLRPHKLHNYPVFLHCRRICQIKVYLFFLTEFRRCLTYVREAVQRASTKSQLHKSHLETLLSEKVTLLFQLERSTIFPIRSGLLTYHWDRILISQREYT
jgi:hypothetical protein